MIRFVERLLRLHPGEGRRGLLLFTYLFLVIASFVASKAVRDALFLERYRAVQLPYVDMAIGLLVGLVVSIYLRIGRRVALHTLQAGSLVLLSATALAFWWLSVTRSGGWLFPVIYVWVGMFGVLAPAQVWTLANYVFTTRAAKRVFGLIGSGAIVGWIVGGLLTERSARQLGTENILLVVAGVLMVSAVLVVLVWRERPTGIEEPELEAGRHGGLRDSLVLVWSSPYLRSIACLVFVSSLVTTVAGWQFKAVAKAHIPETDALAAFFGTFNFYAGLLSLGAQLLLTTRLLRTFGIGFGLFIVPTLLAASTVSLLIAGSLAAAVFLKGSDQVVRYSLDKATVELLYLPVPASQTFQIKSFIDTVVWRTGDGLAGVIVLVCAGWVGLSAAQVGSVNIVLIGVWMAVAFVARRQYVQNLTISLRDYRIDTERAAAPVLDRTSVDIVARSLASDDAGEVLYALGVFEAEHAKVVHPAVRGLLTHASPDIRMRAVRLLASAGDLSVMPTVERLLYDRHLEVRTEALLYLTQHATIDPLDRIDRLGEFADYSIRAATVAFLARPGKAQNVDAAQLILDGMVRDDGDDGRRTRIEAARLLTWLPDIFESPLRRLLHDSDPEVARHAVVAVGVLRKRRLVPEVLDLLREPLIVPDGIDALARFGDAIVGTVRDFFVDPAVPREIRRELPELLLRIGTANARFVLMENLTEPDMKIRFRIIRALNKLARLAPLRVEEKLVDVVLHAEILGLYRSHQVLGAVARHAVAPEMIEPAVRDAIEHETERIFRLLQVRYPGIDMHSAYVGLRSGNLVVHDNALEFVETVLSPQLRELLVPLLDREVTIDERVRVADAVIGVPVATLAEAARILACTDDSWLQACAAYVIGQAGLAGFTPQLDAWIADPDPLLREAAREARTRLEARAHL